MVSVAYILCQYYLVEYASRLFPCSSHHPQEFLNLEGRNPFYPAKKAEPGIFRIPDAFFTPAYAQEQGTPRDADPGGEQNQVWGLKLEQTVWTSARPTPISPLVRADSVETSNTRLSGARVDSVEDPTNTSLAIVHPTN